MALAGMGSAANEISGEAPCRMCANVQNDRLPSRMITATAEASEVGVSVGERAGPCAGWRDVRAPLIVTDRPHQPREGAQRQEVGVNRDRLEGKWKQFSGRLRERWGRLTNDPLSTVAGKCDQVTGRIQESQGIYKEEGTLQLKEFLQRIRN